jgi:hypothetical protein
VFVAEPLVGQARATGMRTRSARFERQVNHLLGKAKAPAVFTAEARIEFC